MNGSLPCHIYHPPPWAKALRWHSVVNVCYQRRLKTPSAMPECQYRPPLFEKCQMPLTHGAGTPENITRTLDTPTAMTYDTICEASKNKNALSRP